MTSSMPSPMDALNGLLEERRRYEGWLAQLEARRGETPPHVLERVRIDYDQRLRVVTEQLRGRAEDLEESVRAMNERVQTLLTEENARRDERAEAELRSAVGEYAPEQSRELLARSDDVIGRLAGERGAVSAELHKLQEILALVRRPGVEASQRLDGSPPVMPTAPAAGPTPQRPVASPPPLAPTDADAAAAFNELAFLQSVVQPRETTAADQMVSTFAPNATPLGSRRGEPAGVQPAQHEGVSARAAGELDGTPAFLKDMPTEQAKTLKCQECGTMNYATEWYCERCGGELAAM